MAVSYNVCCWATAFLILVLAASLALKPRRKVTFEGKHCVITGGSSGLGKALAALLLEGGASVTIIARNSELLEAAKAELEKAKKRPDQFIHCVSADVTDYSSISGAIAETRKSGGAISALFSCAGSSKPGLFLQQPIEDFKAGMTLNYFGTVNTVKLVAEAMIADQVRDGRIVMVASTLGLMGLIGYAQYSPTKFAIRGLAECLRQELLPYGINVSVYFVSTIHSPGYEAENKTKPAITRLIEDGEASDASPRARATQLLKGLKRGHFFITSDLVTDIIRTLNSGIAPGNGAKDFVLRFIGQIVFPFWRLYADYLVVSHHEKEK